MEMTSYGFMIDTERWAGCDSFVIRVMAKRHGDAYPTNPDTGGESEFDPRVPAKQQNLMLYGLEIRVFQSPAYGPTRLPAEFHNLFSVSPEGNQRIMKTYKAINRQLVKSEGGFGDIGDYLMAIAKAIGATWFVIPEGPDSRRGFYSDTKWQFVPLIEVRDEARRRWSAMRLEFEKTKPAEIDA